MVVAQVREDRCDLFLGVGLGRLFVSSRRLIRRGRVFTLGLSAGLDRLCRRLFRLHRFVASRLPGASWRDVRGGVRVRLWFGLDSAGGILVELHLESKVLNLSDGLHATQELIGSGFEALQDSESVPLPFLQDFEFLLICHL